MNRQVDVIIAALLPAALAVKAATATIPIVFISGSDPVNRGLVASLNRPGGNITGVTIFSSALIGKRIGLMRQLVPNLQSVALLVNDTLPNCVCRRASPAGRKGISARAPLAQVSKSPCHRAAAVRYFGDQFVDDGLAKYVERFHHRHEGVWPANDVLTE